MYNNLKIIYRYLKAHGLKKTLIKIFRHLDSKYRSFLSTPLDRNIKKHYIRNEDLSIIHGIKIAKLNKKVLNKRKMIVTWITCDFSKGSGGHTTIFRFINEFSKHGVENHLVIRNPHVHHDESEVRETLTKHFKFLKVKVILLKNIDVIRLLKGDMVIGTDWVSQYLALSCPNFSNRYLFLQDRESLFNEYNSRSILADELLMLPEKFISAGKWIKSITKFNKGHFFELGVDLSVYKIDQYKRSTEKIKIAIYSRWYSPRRGVDLIWSILEILGNSHRNIEIHLFGFSIANTILPFEKKFNLIDHGIISPLEMNHLFNTCHIGIAFSLTNYSLVTLEMKASGLEVYDLDTDSNRIAFKGKDINLLSPIPYLAANKIQEKIKELKSKKYMHASGLSNLYKAKLDWDKQTDKIFKLISKENKYSSTSKIKVSICIPVYKGTQNLNKLIPLLNSQRNVDIELVIIETKSNENISALLKSFKGKFVHKIINKKDFQHGKTRNLLAQLATHQDIIFLTQDALPVSPNFAYDMISPIDIKSGIVATYCRHKAYEEHSAFLKNDLEEFFNHTHYNFPAIVSYRDVKLSNDAKFFSTNACAINKNTLIKYPFPEVNHGEDQLWSLSILKLGLKKAFLNYVEVYHSHDYMNETFYARVLLDTAYHKIHFNFNWQGDLNKELRLKNEKDKQYAKKMNIPAQTLKNRLIQNELYFKAIKNSKDIKSITTKIANHF